MTSCKAETHAAQQNSKERPRPIKRLLHRGKLIILTMALASDGPEVSVVATPEC